MVKKREKNIKIIKGIKGWLLLFVIISILNLMGLICTLYRDFFIYLWGGLIGKIILVSTIISAFLILNYLILMFMKSKYAVLCVITALIYDAVINFSLLIMLLNISSRVSEIYLSAFLVIFNLLWVLYFNFSKRVRNTFLRKKN